MSIHYNRPFAEPEVDPFFADGMVTFSQQRYVPRPRPLLPVARTILPSHQRQIHALYIEAATSKVTFSRARTLLPLNFTHEGDAFARVGQDFWMRKVHYLYRRVTKSIHALKRKTLAGLVSACLPVGKGFNLLWNSALHVLEGLKRSLDNAVEPFAETQPLTIRVEIQ